MSEHEFELEPELYTLTKHEIHESLNQVSKYIGNPQGKHCCHLFKYIEKILFVNETDISLVDEQCPICLVPLHEKDSVIKCCENYSAQLKCGHHVHVHCQIGANPNLYQCSVCRNVLCHPVKLLRDLVEMTNSFLLPHTLFEIYQRDGITSINDTQFMSRLRNVLDENTISAFLEGISLCIEFDRFIERTPIESY